ncbi:MAG: hypothetical protein FWG16_00595 [Micrococcales bacterium]|nr:hypothetical protein [Micrococcales bacterium]
MAKPDGTTTHWRPWRRFAATAVLAGCLAAVAGGCVRANGSFVVSEQDMVSGSVVMAVSDKSLEALANASAQSLDQLTDQIVFDVASTIGQMGSQTATEPYAKDGYSGAKVTFTDANLSDLDGGAYGIGIQLTHSDNQFLLAGRIDLPTPEDYLGYPATIAGLESVDAASIGLDFTFPGKVTTSNGTAQGNSVSWSIALGQVTEINAVAQDSVASQPPWIIFGSGALALLIGLVLLFVWLLRRRRRLRAT